MHTHKYAQKWDDYTGQCPECGGIIVSDGHETYCSSCGFVIESYSMMPERPLREDGQLKMESGRGAGQPVTPRLHDHGLHTVTRGRIGWLQKRFTRDSSSADGLGLVELYCSKLSLPRYARETAAHIYRKARRYNNNGRRRSTKALAGAAVYLACRIHGIVKLPIDYKEAGFDPDVFKIARELKRILGVKGKPVTPADYVPIICNRLGLPELVQQAIEIVTEVSCGKHPAAVAATAVYVVAGRRGMRVSQKAVASATGITDATIRNVLRFLREKHILEHLRES